MTERTEPCHITYSRCDCALPVGHETPHVCFCGGSYDFRGEDQKELWVYALPSNGGLLEGPYLTLEECAELANEMARGKPLFIEERDVRPFSFRAGRGPITFFKVPQV